MSSVYRFVVRGRVQGVFFRQSCARQARALGVHGWVMNRDDGCVEGRAGGDEAALATLREWLARGPPAARVEQVEWEACGDAIAEGFAVRR
ncbi:MAG TPA: acylphosphatase [Candidatus Binatia bacterium]|nr:acylphosphatase [Candidatus Binatia bacterium]